jgi:hypothetical protein
MPAGDGRSFSLSADVKGSTDITPSAASSAYVFAGSAGATTLVRDTGASTLVGGSSKTLELAAGSNPTMLVVGLDTTMINGTTGIDTEVLIAARGDTSFSP